MSNTARINVSLTFEEVHLPPFTDILVLGKKNPHGRNGVAQCLNLLSPDDFVTVEIEDDCAQAILINRKILKKISKHTIVELLKERVIPFISPGELVKVDMTVTLHHDAIEINPEK